MALLELTQQALYVRDQVFVGELPILSQVGLLVELYDILTEQYREYLDIEIDTDQIGQLPFHLQGPVPHQGEHVDIPITHVLYDVSYLLVILYLSGIG